MQTLVDSHDRSIIYLRLSVTDRCQFRCLYCLPPEGISVLPKKDYLTPDEMERFVRAVAEMGVWRLRLTGGEPLLRKDIVSLVARFSVIPGIRDLALTTNGERLPDLVSDLKRAGLERVNISLDSLDPARFRQLTLSNSFEKVWEGIQLSIAEGLKVKINVVLMKGISREEIDRFADLAFENPLEVRFIEFMPLCGTGWSPDLVVPVSEVRRRISERYSLIRLLRGSEVAESCELGGGQGRVGFIGSMTEPFCSTCSRIRMSATGKIQLCLFSKLQYDLLPMLRRNTPPEEIQREVQRILFFKPAGHPWTRRNSDAAITSSPLIRSIGG